MSRRLDYRITAAKGLRLGFNVEAAAVTAGRLAYNPANPAQHQGKAVTLSGLQQIDLAAAGERVLGEIVVVEPPEGMSTKVTVNLGPVLWLKYTGAAPAFGSAVVGAAGADGDGYVAAAVPDAGGVLPAASVGTVIQVDTNAGECAVLMQGSRR